MKYEHLDSFYCCMVGAPDVFYRIITEANVCMYNDLK